MAPVLTLQDIANLVTFVVPGYFAICVQQALFTKVDRDFSRTLIESVVWSLPLVAVSNWVWQMFAGSSPTSTSVRYVLLVITVAVVNSVALAYMRGNKRVDGALKRLGFGSPDDDVVQSQFRRLSKMELTTVTLKNGEVFSGRPQRGGSYKVGMPREYFFDTVAWYDIKTNEWDVRSGGVIINLDDVAYIETL